MEPMVFEGKTDVISHNKFEIKKCDNLFINIFKWNRNLQST